MIHLHFHETLLTLDMAHIWGHVHVPAPFIGVCRLPQLLYNGFIHLHILAVFINTAFLSLGTETHICHIFFSIFFITSDLLYITFFITEFCLISLFITVNIYRMYAL